MGLSHPGVGVRGARHASGSGEFDDGGSEDVEEGRAAAAAAAAAPGKVRAGNTFSIELPGGWRDETRVLELRKMLRERGVKFPRSESKDDLIIRLGEVERLGPSLWGKTMATMQGECKELGLPSSGVKRELWSRLLNKALEHRPWNPEKYEELVRKGLMPAVVRPARIVEPPTVGEWLGRWMHMKWDEANFDSSRSRLLLDPNRERRLVDAAVLDAAKIQYSWSGHPKKDASEFVSMWSEAAWEKVREDRSRVAGQRLDEDLWPFQESGVDYLLQARCCFLADEMGLGKTVQALTAVRIAGTFPCIVVCPATLKLNWQKEVQMWTPDATVEILQGVTPVMDRELKPPADITIVNYDILHARVRELLAFQPKGLIVDECHRIKNADALSTKCVALLAEAVHGIPTEIPWSKGGRDKAAPPIAPEARPKWPAQRPDAASKMDHMVVLMSGTPMLSCPYDLFAQMAIMGRFRYLFPDGHGYFTKRHCGTPRLSYQSSLAVRRGYGHAAAQGVLEYKGAERLPELHQRLRSKIMVRRQKKWVLTLLPEKVRGIEEVEMSKASKKLYEEAFGEFSSQAERFDSTPARDRQEAQNKLTDAIAKVRQRIGLAKVEFAVDRIHRFFEEADQEWEDDVRERNLNEEQIRRSKRTEKKKLLVFAWHVDVVGQMKQLLKRSGNPYGVRTITGATSLTERDEIVTAFQEEEFPRLLICNIRAAGVGITLTRCSDVFFVEETFTPADIDQAEDRVHRIGQKAKGVMIKTFLLKGTIDEMVHEIIGKKRTVVNAAIEGESPEHAAARSASIETQLISWVASQARLAARKNY